MQGSSGSGHELQRGALGVTGIVFFVVAAAAPMGATLGASPIAFMSNGVGAPGAYAVAAIVLLVFAVGFAAMARHVSSAGGFAVVIARGLGERAGFAAAFVALLSYNGMLLGLYGISGFFAESIFADLFGIHASWVVWSLIALALVAILGYNDVNLSARVLGTLMICEVVILLILDVVVLGGGGESGWTAKPFAPSEIFSGAAGVAFLFAFGSFVGFEATTIYGEEAREPRRTVARATYAAVLLIGVFYVLNTFAITVAYGPGAIAEAAAKNPGGLFFAAGAQYVGSGFSDVMQVLLITSMFAVLLAFHNTLARYLFAIGRAGLLPAALGRTHGRHGAPYVASVVQSALSIVVVGAFMIAGADPFAELYSWLVGLGTVGVLCLQAVASLAVIGFFWRTRLERNPWTTIIAPLLGTAGLVTAVVLSLRNFDVLTGRTTGLVPLLPWLLPIAALIGLAIGVARSRRGASLERGFEQSPGAEPAPPPAHVPA
jgi:amino acid transporter